MIKELQQLFRDNFMAYWHSHVAHVNTVGRHFVGDHKLLKGIYEDRQEQIDVIAELLRTCEEMMPDTLADVIDGSRLTDLPVAGTADSLLEQTLEDISILCDSYVSLNDAATKAGEDHIANYTQDQILALKKQAWMLRSTLDER